MEQNLNIYQHKKSGNLFKKFKQDGKLYLVPQVAAFAKVDESMYARILTPVSKSKLLSEYIKYI